MLRRLLAAAMLATAAAGACAGTVHVACPRAAAGDGCEFVGDDAIQQAVDAAADHDTVLVRAGTYAPARFRDLQFKELTLRGHVVVDGRTLEIAGEPGATLEEGGSQPASGIVIRGGQVVVRGLALRALRAADREDTIYDGHGLLLVDAVARIEDVTIEGVAKMALTLRGTSSAEVRRIRILDGHVGIWLEETSRLTLVDAVVRNNDSAGLCAYGQAATSIDRSLFDGNRDDGVYAEGDASIDVDHSVVVANGPYGVRAAGSSRVRVRRSVLSGNAKGETATEGGGQVTLGAGVVDYGPRAR